MSSTLMTRVHDGALALLAGAWCVHLTAPDDNVPLVLVHGLVPWWSLGALLPLALSASILRALRLAPPTAPRPGGSGVAWVRHLSAVALALAASRQWLPLAAGGSGAPALTVTSANVWVGNHEADALIDELVEADADLLLLQEVDHDAWRRFGDDPRLARWPHRQLGLRDDAYGIATLSKLPLLHPMVVDDIEPTWLIARVRVGGREIDVVHVHATPPYDPTWIPAWQRQLASLPDRCRVADCVIAGDLNATLHHPTLRRVLATGFVDAGEHTGTVVRTWPNDRWFPPLMGLDHVLLRGDLTAASLRVGRGVGSDHRPLHASLAWTSR